MSNKLNPSTQPAGYKRDEAKAVVTDQLAEQADKLAGQGANVAALEPDEEIQYSLEVSEMYDRQPGWAYRWVYVGPQGRDMIHGMVQHQGEGWKAVKSTDKEVARFPECVNAFGMFVVGDLALMKIPQGRKKALEERDRLRQAAKEAATLEEAQSLTREAQKKFGNLIRTIPTDKIEGTLDELNRASPQFVNQLKAQNQFNSMLRTGSVPGTPLTTQTL